MGLGDGQGAGDAAGAEGAALPGSGDAELAVVGADMLDAWAVEAAGATGEPRTDAETGMIRTLTATTLSHVH